MSPNEPPGDDTTTTGEPAPGDGDAPVDDGEDEPPAEPPPSPNREIIANNTAVFPVVIEGPVALPTVHREIKMTARAEYGLSVEKAFLFDGAGLDYYAVVIRSDAATTQCFVNIELISFFDAAGNVVDTDELGFIDGSVGGNFVSTNTCLEPGATGILGGLLGGDASEISYATLDFDEPFTDPPNPGTIVAGRLRFGDESIRTSVDNQTDKPASLGFSVYWLLDENRNPIKYGFFDACVDSESRVELCGEYRFDSDADYVLVNLDFETQDPVALRSLSSEVRERYERFRLAREQRRDRYRAARR